MNCLNLSVIPQFGGTCWFNAILMIALYSQLTRKIVIKSSKTWDKTNKFLNCNISRSSTLTMFSSRLLRENPFGIGLASLRVHS